MVRKPKSGDSQVPKLYTVSKVVAFASQDARMPCWMRKGDGKAQWLLTREKKITDINWKGPPEINLLLGAGQWVGKLSHSLSKDGDSTTFPALLFNLGKGCSLTYNSLFMCCGHCHSVVIWYCEKDINCVIFATMLKIVEEREKVTHISIDFPLTLKAWVNLCSCCRGFVPPWLSRCGFSVFIPKAYQEVLKSLIHGDMLLFHGVKEGMAELDLNAQGSSVMFHDWDRQKAFLLGLYRDSVKHMLHNTFPMFLPIWEAEPEGTLCL